MKQIRKRRSHDDWLSLIQQQEDSGFNAAQFCLEHELDHKYFCKRKRELVAHRQPVLETNDFIKIQSSAHSAASKPGYLILHHQHAELHIPTSANVAWLAQLMQALS
jgi:hypothetical protein